MRSILVTGASGVIGSLLVKNLVAKGYKVDTIGRGASNTYVCDLARHGTVEFNQKYDLLLHLAVDQKSVVKNIKMAENIIKMRQSFGKIVYFSSVSVYKDQSFRQSKYTALDETLCLTNYERGKILCEELFRRYAFIYRLAPFFDMSYTHEISKRVKVPLTSLYFTTSWPRYYSFSSIGSITNRIASLEKEEVYRVENLCDDKTYSQNEILKLIDKRSAKMITICIPMFFKTLFTFILSKTPDLFKNKSLVYLDKLFFSHVYV